jgi:hypothetical protein
MPVEGLGSHSHANLRIGACEMQEGIRSESTSDLANNPARKSNVRMGIADSAISKISYRRHALHRWWLHSTARKVAREFCNFPARILAIRQLPNWGLFRLPQTPAGLPQNRFLQSCSEDTLSLCREYPWATHLDAQMAAESYARGAAWAHSNFGKKSDKES